jgi:hypothetical protein
MPLILTFEDRQAKTAVVDAMDDRISIGFHYFRGFVCLIYNR